MALPNNSTHIDTMCAAPKYGTLIPNRIFVGGISGDTTESELCQVFSAYGNVKSTKIIVDRAGISKGYGFVTFETEQEALRLQNEMECVVLHDRKLNIAPAIKKQLMCVPHGTMYYPGSHAVPINNIATVDQFAAVYSTPGISPIYTPGLHMQQFYPYYNFPLGMQTVWPQGYNGPFPC